MPNRNFFIEYYPNQNVVRQRIRDWADEHRQIFPNYGFTNRNSDFPITHLIANKLERQYGFIRHEINGEVILRNNHRNFRF
jgi:hypothetical protein